MCASSVGPQCEECQKGMLLVTQLFCQLDSAFNRTLYIFACVTPDCQGKAKSWRIFRSQTKVDSDLHSASVDESSGIRGASSTNPNHWCDSADDWGLDDEECVRVVMETDCKSQQQLRNENGDTKTSEDSIIQKGKETGSPDMTDDCEKDQNEKTAISECSIHFQQMHIHDDSARSSLDDCVESSPLKCQFTSPVTASSNKVAAERTTILSHGDLSEFDNQVSGNSQRRFIPYFISTLAESLCVQQFEDRHVHQLLKEYERKEGCGYRETFYDDSGGSGEKYEKSEIKHGDKQLYRFKKTLTLCPEQCLRYQWAGEPLFLSDSAGCPLSTSIPPCPVCGERRVFELQLMPALAYVLQIENTEERPIEFGTVLIFTCVKSCWQDGDVLREEVVVLMSYPDEGLFNK
ncbi:programmed cell death protein 2-like isoform X2 [Liolophura sinensis]